LFFSTDVFRELVVRAMIFHKEYYSDLVYIAEPLLRVTGRSHKMLLANGIRVERYNERNHSHRDNFQDNE